MSCGQPFAACQARLGAQSRSAIPMAAQAHGERTTSQRRARTSPTASPAPRNRSVSLFSRPIPVTTPTASQRRRSPPASSFTSSHRMTAQASRSGSVVVSRWPRAEIAGEGGRDRREDLRPSRSAQVARHQRDQDDDEPHLEGGQHPHGRRRDARAAPPTRPRAAGSAAAGRRSRTPGAGPPRRSTSRRRGSRRRPTRPAARRP